MTCRSECPDLCIRWSTVVYDWDSGEWLRDVPCWSCDGRGLRWYENLRDVAGCSECGWTGDDWVPVHIVAQLEDW